MRTGPSRPAFDAQRSVVRVIVLFGLVPIVVSILACSSPQSSRMTVEDFIEMSEQMAQSLRSSEALAERGPESEPWVVSIERVRNLSSDVMTRSEQWMIMQRLRNQADIQTLSEQKNIRFVLPPEEYRRQRQTGELAELARSGFGAERSEVTHVLGATFRSLTRADERGRIDHYYCEFELLEMGTGEPVWLDRFEYARQARGPVRN